MSAEQDIVLGGVSQSLIDPLAASDAYIWKKYLAAKYSNNCAADLISPEKSEFIEYKTVCVTSQVVLTLRELSWAELTWC